MKRPAFVLVLLLAASQLHAAELGLPDPLTARSGEKVTSAEMWQRQRRGEVLELFRTHMYGRAPVGRPTELKFETIETVRGVMDGLATRKQIRISYRGPGGEGAIGLVLFVPEKKTRPAPCFLLICNRGAENIDPTRAVKMPFWPAEQIVARGYAAAAFLNKDVAPDQDDGFKTGVYPIFEKPEVARPPDAWGAIAAWAWGASRVMDYLETDPDIDARRVAVVGHSRGGKTALWAGAEDERFALTVSNDSGCTGARLIRHEAPGSESIKIINKAFPHWFAANYRRYDDRERDLPVDQHMLLALLAPRLAYVASATEDQWADPQGEWLSCFHAGPVYRLFNRETVPGEQLAPPESPLHEGQVGYHLRTGGHGLTEFDWKCFMDFADRHFWSSGSGVPSR